MAAFAVERELNDMARLCVLKSPVDSLKFSRMRVSEGLSRLFEIEIEAVSERGDISPKELLRKSVTVEVTLPDEGKRWYNGYVTRFGLGSTDGRNYVYRMTLRPWLWLLTRTSDCKVFQGKNVPDILKDVFHDEATSALALAWRLGDAGAYEPCDYCVQYNETDFNFVSRLMEREGICYFFEHTDGAHKLVIIDDKGQHRLDDGENGKANAGAGTYSFIPASGGQVYSRDHVDTWVEDEDIQPGEFVVQDHLFDVPTRPVSAQRKPEIPAEFSNPNSQMFEYPGAFDSSGEADHYAEHRAEELNGRARVFHGSGPLATFRSGAKFRFADHPRKDQNGEYLLVSTEFEYVDPAFESSNREGSHYSCRFVAIPSKQQYRPPRVTQRPLIHGVQCALVTGPAGEEIHCDKYGRVKVQFYWDRYGKHDDKTSCWVRVGFLAAGARFGFISIPRIGWEVIVSFLEGDPDRPLVTGVVYNPANMPPWDLPANRTQWGMLSRSSKGGGVANANALRFEDKKGAEQVWLHAEKNQDIEVENDETHWVGHDRTKTIDHDETTHVKHDRTETVDHDETITIGNDRTEHVGRDQTDTIDRNKITHVIGNHTEKIDQSMSIIVGTTLTETVNASYTETVLGAMTLTVGAALGVTVGGALGISVTGAMGTTVSGSRSESVGGDCSADVSGNASSMIKGTSSVTVKKDASQKVEGASATEVTKEYLLKAKKIQLSADDEIELKVGSAQLIMKKNGDVTINGNKINIKGSGDVTIKGSKIADN